jgi:hypothetical protein
LKTTKDKKLKTKSASVDKHILPDKNPIKPLKQNGLPKSKSSVEEPWNTSDTTKRPILSRKKTENTTKPSIIEVTNKIIRNSNKDKIESQYNEKRGISSIYIPKDVVSQLSYKNKLSETKRTKDKPTSSKNVEKPMPRYSSRERQRSRTLSPCEIKVLQDKSNKINLENFKKEETKEALPIENDPDTTCNYEDDFEV